MRTRNYETLAKKLKPGSVYRRDGLMAYSHAIDRDLMTLVKKAILEKVAAGLYYRPATSRFGTLPPADKKLVRAFLRDSHFLMFSRNEYNTLGLGLTQLYNRVIVYNHKRHGVFQLADTQFDFRRPAYGFPNQVTPAFLLVDLLNHVSELDEDVKLLKEKVKQLPTNILKQAKQTAEKYGKVATKKFFNGLNLS